MENLARYLSEMATFNAVAPTVDFAGHPDGREDDEDEEFVDGDGAPSYQEPALRNGSVPRAGKKFIG